MNHYQNHEFTLKILCYNNAKGDIDQEVNKIKSKFFQGLNNVMDMDINKELVKDSGDLIIMTEDNVSGVKMEIF